MLVVNTPSSNITFIYRAWRNGMTKIILTSIVCLVLTACVSGSKNITSSYISPLQYSAYDVADCLKLNQKQKSCATI
jgi:starvation-inducible outer membrane lipoprotein